MPSRRPPPGGFSTFAFGNADELKKVRLTTDFMNDDRLYYIATYTLYFGHDAAECWTETPVLVSRRLTEACRPKTGVMRDWKEMRHVRAACLSW